ncbi:MAG: AIPR family protein [Candidatus Marinimicrobia bacterium]|nr:AIPR family protein [Candidatus Neomarinimicrobiota bacterium]
MNESILGKKEFVETCERLYESVMDLKNLVPEDTDDPQYLFNYYVANVFEGIDPESAYVTDGSNDNGIDFFVVREERITVYQCKLPYLDKLKETSKPKSFDSSPIKEIKDGLSFITDEASIANANQKVKIARTEYRNRKRSFETSNDDQQFKIELVIAIFGVLTDSARKKYIEFKQEIEQNENISLKIRQFEDFLNVLNVDFLTKRIPKKISLKYVSDTMVFLNRWGYCLVPAYQFYQLFNEHQLALFDLNVRFHYKRSSVNKEIENTLTHQKGQKNFHLLNNGISISCVGQNNIKAENRIKLISPQIINGCQTVLSIYTAYNDMSQYLQESFEQKCFVPVRIVETDDQNLLSDIVIATNNQNKMSARNLLSNTLTQRNIQKGFNNLPSKWFYQRKDEEYSSLKRYKQRGFKASEYENRILDNEELAKCWLSFIGFSTLASEKIRAFDKIEDKGNYEWLFEKRPLDEHWEKMIVGPQVKFDDNTFESFHPYPEQYLISYLTYNFMKVMIPSASKNRSDAIQRLRNTGQIEDYATPETINEKLNGDDVYIKNRIIDNMKEVLAELVAVTLIKKYGPLDRDISRKVLKLKGFKELLENPDFKSYKETIRNLSNEDKQEIVLWKCFHFLSEVVDRWKINNKQKYLSSQRRIRLLHDSKTIEEFKILLKEIENATKQYGYEWKEPKVSFLTSLPEI